MRVAIVTLAVFAGWFAILPATVQALYLVLQSSQSGDIATPYSVLLTAGWTTFMLSLFIGGRLGDRSPRHRFTVISFSAIGLAISGLWLSTSSDVAWLSFAWLLLQIPVGGLVSSALALGITAVSTRARRAASGLTGSAPILAMILGSALLTLPGITPAFALGLGPWIAAACSVPLVFLARRLTTVELSSVATGNASATAPATSATEATPTRDSSATRTSLARVRWWTFLVVGFLFSCATSVTNGYLVMFTESHLEVRPDDVASSSSLIILAAALTSLVCGIAVGTIVAKARTAVVVYSASAIVMAVGLAVMVLVPTVPVALICGAVFGFSFGCANGLELTLVASLQPSRNRVGEQFADYTIATTLPYVLVPVVSALILGGNSDNVGALWWLAVGTALVAGVLGFLRLTKR